MDIRQEIPIKSFSIDIYVILAEKNKAPLHLILKRAQSQYLGGSWQMVSGKVEKDEKGWEAALRELKEETDITLAKLYSADRLVSFYEPNQNCINLVPVFLGVVYETQKIVLTEHTEYKWITSHEAGNYLEFETQIKMLQYLEEKFIFNKPFKFLEIDISPAF